MIQIAMPLDLLEQQEAHNIITPNNLAVFVKRALRFLYIFDDIRSQDEFWRTMQWWHLNSEFEREYLGKWVKQEGGYIKIKEDGSGRFTPVLPDNCDECDVVVVDSPPDEFSASILELVRRSLNKDSSLRDEFPKLPDIVKPEYLARCSGLPNDFEVLIELDSIISGDNQQPDEMQFFINITQKFVSYSKDEEYLQFEISSQTFAGLLIIKRIWMTLIEFWMASKDGALSISEEMLGPIFLIYLATLKKSLFESEVTVGKVAFLLISNILGRARVANGNRQIGDAMLLRKNATAILYDVAEKNMNRADEILKNAKRESDIEAFYDGLYLAYSYFFAAKLCYSGLAEFGDNEAKESARVRANAAEEKAVRISDSLTNAIYDINGGMFARDKEEILKIDDAFDRNVQIYDVFHNKLKYPASYKERIQR